MFESFTDMANKNKQRTVSFGSRYTQGTHWYTLIQTAIYWITNTSCYLILIFEGLLGKRETKTLSGRSAVW